MRTILVSLITLLQLFAASARAEQPNLGFDGSAGTSMKVFLSNLPEMRAPIPKVPLEVRFMNVVADKYGRPYQSHEEAKLRADGKAREDQYKAAGYIITESRVGWNKDNLEYYFWYRPPEGYPFGEIQQHRIAKDSNNNFYDYISWDTLSLAGAEAEKRLQAAGYNIASSYFYTNRWGTGTYDYNLEYGISYIAPVQYTAGPVRSYTLARDVDYELYPMDSWYKVKDDGKVIEERLKAAGFIVLHGRPEVLYWGQGKYDYNTQYYIQYIPPVKYSSVSIKTYYLTTDAQNKPYPWGSKSTLTKDGKAIEARLKAAGNVIIHSWTWSKRWGQGPTDLNIEYVIEYAPTQGESQNEILKFELSKGRDGKPYLGNHGKYQAEVDGKAMAANFAAAGYVVLEARLHQYGYEDRWSYVIHYTRSAA